ncbi:MAG: hypothetical protein EBV03_01465 [Proteobacteria bacterium]|nr:hypothetical protein [Pseudomonadota bacterium]
MKIAYNMLWMSPTFPVPGQAHAAPIPERIRSNILHVAEMNDGADVLLWTDPARFTAQQMAEFKSIEREAEHKNIHVRSLRDIAQYRSVKDPKGNLFFDQPNDAPRSDKNSIFWRQVDVARIMATQESAREGYGQVFYADADITNLNVKAYEVEQVMQKHGALFCSGWVKGSPIENGLFALTQQHAPLLEPLLKDTLAAALVAEVNGFNTLHEWAKDVVMPAVGHPDPQALCFTPHFLMGKPVTVAYDKKKKNGNSSDWVDSLPRDGHSGWRGA